MKYAIVIEKAEENYSADVPDLAGWVAVGDTIAEVEAAMPEAIEFFIWRKCSRKAEQFHN